MFGSMPAPAPSFEPLREPARVEAAAERLDSEPFVEIGIELAGLEELPRPEPAHVAIRNVRTVV